MKPANGQHIINEIKATLAKHRLELLHMIQAGEIVLLTRRQLAMRDADIFEALVREYVDKDEMGWTDAYDLVEAEHIRAYGDRKYSSPKSFQNSRYERRKKESKSIGQ